METRNQHIYAENEQLLRSVSNFLNLYPDSIDKEMMTSVSSGEGTEDYAYAALMATICGLNVYENSEDNTFFKNYFVPMIRGQNLKQYKDNEYYRNIVIPQEKIGKWEFTVKRYAPYEAFVYDDIETRKNGRILPHIGYFTKEFTFPCVCQYGREWMTVTPNEINTMKQPISTAFGNALTFGLGLGYYVYMISQKAEIDTVTVVERDPTIIELFRKTVLPQFPAKNKIRIIEADAFEFADRELAKGGFDHVFTDIWHDPSDGIELYQKMRQREHLAPNAKFEYWIENTLKCYLGEK